MTRHSLRARFAFALVMGSMLLGAVASPASAAIKTRWVDNDHKAGDGPKACDSANFSTIQGAINASHAGDRVFVCPGDYAEQIIIDVPRLEVRSVIAQAAKIWPPETLVVPDFLASLVTIDAPNVTFRGFKMKILAGDPLFLKPESCEPLDAAIWVRSTGAQVLGNHIKTIGDFSFIGDCGYDMGIVVDDETFGAGAPSFIWRNWVRDFKYDGIFVTPGSSAKLQYNQIRYVHLYDPLTCHLVPVLGVNPNPGAIFPECYGIPARPLNDLEAAAPPQVDGLFGLPIGILVEGAWVNMKGNAVYSTFDTQFYEGAPEFPLTLIGGIVLLAPVDGSKVNVNRVDNTAGGLVIVGEELLIGPPVRPTAKYPSAPDGVSVSGNRISEGIAGLLIVAEDGVYFGNRSHLNIWGSLVFGGDNVFSRNDFRFNQEYDCDDETFGSGTSGTANDWYDVNLGLYNQPEDLCFDYWNGGF